MHIQERCVEDCKMSEDFLAVARGNKYVVQCRTSIGWITLESPEYRNGNSYRAIHKEELKSL